MECKKPASCVGGQFSSITSQLLKDKKYRRDHCSDLVHSFADVDHRNIIEKSFRSSGNVKLSGN